MGAVWLVYLVGFDFLEQPLDMLTSAYVYLSKLPIFLSGGGEALCGYDVAFGHLKHVFFHVGQSVRSLSLARGLVRFHTYTYFPSDHPCSFIQYAF